MISIKGCNFIRDYVATNVGYLGVGEDNTPVFETDETMGGELQRFAQSSTVSTVNKIVTKEFLVAASELNGDFLKEFSLFVTDQTVLEDGDSVVDWSVAGDVVFTSETSPVKIGTYAVKAALTFSSGTGDATNISSLGDISAITESSSGQPLEGWISVWVNAIDTSKLDATDAIEYRIGSSATDYVSAKLQATSLVSGVYYNWVISLNDATVVGVPDWTSVDYQKFIFKETASTDVYLDHLMLSGKMFSRTVMPTFEKTDDRELVFDLDIAVDNQ